MILSGIVFATFAVLLFALARVSSFKVADTLFVHFDAFAINIPHQFGSPLVTQARPIGGFFSLIGGIVFITITLVLILQRAANNVTIQRSVVVLNAKASKVAAALPVFSAEPWGAGLQVRIMASGDGSACASATWSATNVGWKFSSTASCSGSASSQLVFSCADCDISAASSISISLHYSCQSLFIEAAAMDAEGAITSYALPIEETTAAPGSLLSTITWTLPTLLSVVNSTISPSARGFTLTDASHLVTSQALSTAVGSGGLAVLPTVSSVTIMIALPLNTFYALSLLSETQSIISLFTSIIGLAGIFGLFGTMLGMAEFIGKKATTLKRAKITVVPTEKAVVERDYVDFVSTDNPPHTSAADTKINISPNSSTTEASTEKTAAVGAVEGDDNSLKRASLNVENTLRGAGSTIAGMRPGYPPNGPF